VLTARSLSGTGTQASSLPVSAWATAGRPLEFAGRRSWPSRSPICSTASSASPRDNVVCCTRRVASSNRLDDGQIVRHRLTCVPAAAPDHRRPLTSLTPLESTRSQRHYASTMAGPFVTPSDTGSWPPAPPSLPTLILDDIFRRDATVPPSARLVEAAPPRHGRDEDAAATTPKSYRRASPLSHRCLAADKPPSPASVLSGTPRPRCVRGWGAAIKSPRWGAAVKSPRWGVSPKGPAQAAVEATVTVEAAVAPAGATTVASLAVARCAPPTDGRIGAGTPLGAPTNVPPLVPSTAPVGAATDAELDDLEARGWLVVPPSPTALVRAASDDDSMDGRLDF